MQTNDMPVIWYNMSIKGKSQKTNAKSISNNIEITKKATHGTVTTLINRIPTLFAKPIKTVEGKIRNHFYTNAIQIGDLFAVPIKTYPIFKNELDKLIQEYNLYVTKIIEATESGLLGTMVKQQLGDIQDEITVNIPTVDDIKNGYGIELEINCDFSSEKVSNALKILSDDLKATIEKEVEITQTNKLNNEIKQVNVYIINNIKEILNDIKNRCGRDDTEKTHYKTLVKKINNLVTKLPSYNIINDINLTNLLNEVSNKFGNVNKDILKADANARKQIVESADTITKQFANMFN